MGGHTDNPSYEDVCTHTTGHAETVLVEYDPSKITYDKLLTAFFAHSRPDAGQPAGSRRRRQLSERHLHVRRAQATAARAAKDAEQKNLTRPITTSIEPMKAFWIAETYHQQYSERTGDHSCPIRGKLEAI